MVSLASNESRGRYFSESDNSMIEELPTEITHLLTDLEPVFHPVKTTWAAAVILTVAVILEAAIISLTFVCDAITCHVSPYPAGLLGAGASWIVVLILDRYIRYQHERSRRKGYLDFYRQTKRIKAAPLIVLSFGNAVLVMVSAFFVSECEPYQVETLCDQRFNVLRGVISLEFLIIFITSVIYLKKLREFNQKKPYPDVHQEELTTSFLNTSLVDVGIREENELGVIIEKQADQIRYLRQHNAFLGQKILALTGRLNSQQPS